MSPEYARYLVLGSRTWYDHMRRTPDGRWRLPTLSTAEAILASRRVDDTQAGAPSRPPAGSAPRTLTDLLNEALGPGPHTQP